MATTMMETRLDRIDAELSKLTESMAKLQKVWEDGYRAFMGASAASPTEEVETSEGRTAEFGGGERADVFGLEPPVVSQTESVETSGDGIASKEGRLSVGSLKGERLVMGDLSTAKTNETISGDQFNLSLQEALGDEGMGSENLNGMTQQQKGGTQMPGSEVGAGRTGESAGVDRTEAFGLETPGEPRGVADGFRSVRLISGERRSGLEGLRGDRLSTERLLGKVRRLELPIFDGTDPDSGLWRIEFAQSIEDRHVVIKLARDRDKLHQASKARAGPDSISNGVPLEEFGEESCGTAFIVMDDLRENSLTSFSLIPRLTSSLSKPHLPLIDVDLWLMAEEMIQEILYIIQPTLVSERKRKEVIDYVQRLINNYYGMEVFPFGSVPLKTYLPEGDIDLTAVSHRNMEEYLARVVCSNFKSQEQDYEIEVNDVQFVCAQVKIVKCNVKGMPGDISFHQIAGLSALCFLEQVDQFIGKDNLFKRSIILIEAWCYYESRILGTHYGWISTYALEVLVLCIISLFHSSLYGPLAVLYRFLDYYSTLDWDTYCVSIKGPAAIYSRPEIVETVETDGDEFLLSVEFMRKCRELYSVPVKASEIASNEFPIKHLNIVDPLKDVESMNKRLAWLKF